MDYILQDLDRIEVINGPGATLWGSNAVNGVVNITSKDSRDTQGWLVSGLGSNDDSSVAVRYGGMISSDTAYRVYFKEKYDQGFPGEVGTPQSVAGLTAGIRSEGDFGSTSIQATAIVSPSRVILETINSELPMACPF